MSTLAETLPSFVKLLVRDLARAGSFYGSLGFSRVHADPVFLHLRWAPHADLYLVAAPAGVPLPEPRGAGVLVCYAARDEDVDALAARARALGATVQGPHVQPWNTREVIVVDPEGYRVNFVEPLGSPTLAGLETR